MTAFRRSLVVAPLLAVAVAACSSDSSTGPSGPQPVTIKFAAQVGTQPFVCGQTYSGLGSPATTATATDFMVYVSNVRLLTSTGAEVPVTITADNKWQADNVSLVDFAAGGAGSACPNATTETNTQVVGTVPAGSYTGLKFDLGLPFEKKWKFDVPEFQGRRWSWVDPKKDMEAAILAVRSGQTSLRKIASDSGQDIYDIARSIAADNELFASMGVTLPELTDAPKPAAVPVTIDTNE
jgi:hypothetical protein